MLRPAKAEIEAVAQLLMDGGEDPTSLAEDCIRLVERLRQERTQWAVVFELTPGIYQGYGFWATRLMAEKQMPKLPMAQIARRGGFVPILGQASADAALAKADEPAAERADFRLIREDMELRKRGWRGNQRDRSQYAS